MDKQARLSAILLAVKENSEKKDQALYGAELSLKTGEWHHMITCANKLIAIDASNILLHNEAKELQIEIENESKEALL